MTDHEFTFDGADGEKILAYRWASSAPVRGVLQIAHGMGEHALRYRGPLAPIIDSGIVVYANDHRGHGRTAKSKEALGDFGAGGFPALANDMAVLSVIARAENPDKKLILLGHSMGSFALQLFLLDHSALIDGADSLRFRRTGPAGAGSRSVGRAGIVQRRVRTSTDTVRLAVAR